MRINSKISTKKKIAIMIDWYLPGTRAGGPVRSIHSLCELLKEEFDICVFTSSRDLGSSEDHKDVKCNVYLKRDGIQCYYFDAAGMKDSNIIRQVNDWKPDLVYLNSFWSYPFSISLVKAKSVGRIRARVLLAPRGMLGSGALSLKSFKKTSFLLLAKIMGWYRRISFHATNEQEKKDIQKHFPDAQVKVVSNVNSGKAIHSPRSKTKGSLKLFYLSRVARVKNLHFALEVLKQVPAGLNIEFDIFGNNEDKQYWQECEAITRDLPSHVHVSYKGELAFQEVQQTLVRYHALFLPTLNENFGHSIVESLLCGCAVIISDQTPWNGVNEAGAGSALALSNKQNFVNAITALAEADEKQFEAYSKAAIEYISSRLNSQTIIQNYRELFGK